MSVTDWPWPAIATTAGAVLTALGTLAHSCWKWVQHRDQAEQSLHAQGWAQVKDRDEEIKLLRRIIDRSRTRENAYATVFELSLLAMKLPQDEQAKIVERMREILAAALLASGAEPS